MPSWSMTWLGLELGWGFAWFRTIGCQSIERGLGLKVLLWLAKIRGLSQWIRLDLYGHRRYGPACRTIALPHILAWYRIALTEIDGKPIWCDMQLFRLRTNVITSWCITTYPGMAHRLTHHRTSHHNIAYHIMSHRIASHHTIYQHHTILASHHNLHRSHLLYAYYVLRCLNVGSCS